MTAARRAVAPPHGMTTNGAASGDEMPSRAPNSRRSSRHGGPGTARGDVDEVLDVARAAAYLGVKESFVRRLVLEKRVRYYKVGRLLRFRSADLDALLAAAVVDPRPAPGGPASYPRRR